MHATVLADPYPRLLVALPILLATCWLAGTASRRLGQPPVVGEIAAGILLGPSALGAIWPAAFHLLFTDSVVAAIHTLAQLGLIFFMYMVGAETDLGAMRGRGLTAVTVSQVSIALPMVLGFAVASVLYPSFGGDVGFLGFSLFLAVSLSVTAFPVLARILTDRGMSRSPVGALALMCAAIDDVAAWCLLTLVIALTRHGRAGDAVVTVGLAVAFAGVMLLAVRPLMARWLGGISRRAATPVLLGGIMLSALITDAIGIHPIVGAFLFGVVTPRSAPAIRRSTGSLAGITVALLLPLFFLYTGLHTHLGILVADPRLWAWAALIIAAAVVGKWGGGTAAARLRGVGWVESLTLGALVNCRGLTEIVVLNVGLQLRVISPTVFSMLMIMTLVTTAMTVPALSLVARLHSRDQAARPSEDSLGPHVPAGHGRPATASLRNGAP